MNICIVCVSLIDTMCSLGLILNTCVLACIAISLLVVYRVTIAGFSGIGALYAGIADGNPDILAESSSIISQFVASIRDTNTDDIGKAIRDTASHTRNALVVVEKQSVLLYSIQGSELLYENVRLLALRMSDAIVESFDTLRDSHAMFEDLETSLDAIVRSALSADHAHAIVALEEMAANIDATARRIHRLQHIFHDIHGMSKHVASLASTQMAGRMRASHRLSKHTMQSSSIAMIATAAGLATYAAQWVFAPTAHVLCTLVAGTAASGTGAWLTKQRATTLASIDVALADMNTLQDIGVNLHTLSQSIVRFNHTLGDIRFAIRECSHHVSRVSMRIAAPMPRMLANDIDTTKTSFRAARKQLAQIMFSWFDDQPSHQLQ